MATPVVTTDYEETASARIPGPVIHIVLTPNIDELDESAPKEPPVVLDEKTLFFQSTPMRKRACVAAVCLVAVVCACAIGFTVGAEPSANSSASSTPANVFVSQGQVESPGGGTSLATTTTPSAGTTTAMGGSAAAPTPTTPQVEAAELVRTSLPPTTTSLPTLPYTDTQFDWLNIANWQGDNDVSAASFAAKAFMSDRIHVSGFNKPIDQTPILRTVRGWSGRRILFLEWTAYDHSDANLWLLPTSLRSQFQTSDWPRCGEYDIFEMFNGDAAIGHAGTTNLYFGDGLEGFGQSTMHMASTNCWAPYYGLGRQPMASSQAAQWQTGYGMKMSMAVIFDSDAHGKYILQVQNPTFVAGAHNTVDLVLDKSIQAEKIYSNGNTYWGVAPVGGCAAGFDGGAGFPYFTNDFRLILQEQNTGYFDVTTFKVFTKN
ncbi:Aste57867_17814 [Aphanomyces stellatus]|uniref:Aste57867_17814 protein n=1 Tax=Aphanomyces stellatus TaxID=120398 RepID=A0A485L8L7_9STRA|nr:hypothetical protein As57867_017753 [Aphanomyces stellatus]VFT94557.1 Aste57867_17814 [Aphanomyces stellatus]